MAESVPAALEGLAEIEGQLQGPGSPFEVGTEEVLGTEMSVFVNRLRSIRELIAQSMNHGDNEYMVFDTGQRITFAHHARAVARTAELLADRFGIGVGDRVAIFSANNPEWVIVHHAALSLGAVSVGMNGWWTTDEALHALGLTSPKLVAVDDRRRERLDAAELDMPVVDLDDFAPVWAETVDDGPELPSQPIGEDDPATILFTSGTTGRPKGAVLSHRAMLAFQQSAAYIGARSMLLKMRHNPPPPPVESEGGEGQEAAPPPPMVRLTPFPLFHVSGMLSTLLTPMAYGFKTVWTTGRFDAGRVLELTTSENLTAWNGAATHIWRILDHPDFGATDTSGVTDVGIGGSASTPALIAATEAALPQTKNSFSSGYGLTECAALISHATNAMLQFDPESVGPPLATVEVRITDDEGNELPDGTDGNIEVRSPMVMLGYWGNPEATEAALVGDRWLHTGDVGRMANQMLHLASRKRDLIIRGGENIHPGEVENRIEAHPAVAEVAVFGVDDKEMGQTVKAVVVPADSSTPLDVTELTEFVAETLAYYKVPAHWEVRSDPMPRNATGKILKHVLQGETANQFVEE